MLPRDIRALDIQYRRIRVYLMLAVQPCLLRQLDADWRGAGDLDAKLRVIEMWVRNISDSEVWLFGGGDNERA